MEGSMANVMLLLLRESWGPGPWYLLRNCLPNLAPAAYARRSSFALGTETGSGGYCFNAMIWLRERCCDCATAFPGVADVRSRRNSDRRGAKFKSNGA